jgi:precorrin-6B C5,15-methyltransferase / cobalt-precorrin-6B C5,C15-methyltransferase
MSDVATPPSTVPVPRADGAERPPVVVVGIGADGWAGLPATTRAEVERADVLVGGPQQLDLVPVTIRAARVPWPPGPAEDVWPPLFEQPAGSAVVVLASGDPMLTGVGTALCRLLGHQHVRVLPAPSAVSLACARLGWDVEETSVVSLVGRPLELLHTHVHPAARLLVIGSDDDLPSRIAALLAARGYGQSVLTVLAGLGGPDEQVHTGTAATWSRPAAALVVTAVECRADRGTMPLPTTPGLPDGAYEDDGHLARSEVRAVALARLAAVPGQLLWDVAAGSGSIAIEWMRAHKACRAVAVEARADRAERIVRNATRLGVPYLRVVRGQAPEVLGRLAAPDAVFIGGGLSTPLLVESCWEALPIGGRLVAAAALPESEAVLAAWHARVGGDLVRLSVQKAVPAGAPEEETAGSVREWEPAVPVTIWSVVRW